MYWKAVGIDDDKNYDNSNFEGLWCVDGEIVIEYEDLWICLSARKTDNHFKRKIKMIWDKVNAIFLRIIVLKNIKKRNFSLIALNDFQKKINSYIILYIHINLYEVRVLWQSKLSWVVHCGNLCPHQNCTSSFIKTAVKMKLIFTQLVLLYL